MEEIKWPPSNWSEMSREEQDASYLSLPEDLEIVVVPDGNQPEAESEADFEAWLNEMAEKRTPEQRARIREFQTKFFGVPPSP